MYLLLTGTIDPSDMAINKEKLHFLYSNADLLLRFLSYSYPLKLSTIDRYYMLLDWTEISVNQQIKWNMKYVSKYEHLLNFGIFRSGNHTGWLGYNEALPWSEEFINKYYEKWEWSILANNKSVIGNPVLRAKFFDELFPFIQSEEGKSEYHAFIERDFIDYICYELEYINNNPELQFNSIAEIEESDEIDWLELSTNEYLPWSIRLIEQYADKWDWQLLSLNEELPWSVEFINHFKDRWVWGEYRNTTHETAFILGLSSNNAIVWDQEMIGHFKDYISWELISANNGVEWNFDLLLNFESYWDYAELSLNENFWYKVFPELLHDGLVSNLLSKIERQILNQKIKHQFSGRS